jgi:hypothetical protein
LGASVRGAIAQHAVVPPRKCGIVSRRMPRPSVLCLSMRWKIAAQAGAVLVCGCSSSNVEATDSGRDAVSGVDVASDGQGALENDSGVPCAGGCLCFAAASCPSGCFLSRGLQPDGSLSETFCSNTAVMCGGGAWSVGPFVDNCGPEVPTYVDAGPDGALCCASADGGPHSEEE